MVIVATCLNEGSTQLKSVIVLKLTLLEKYHLYLLPSITIMDCDVCVHIRLFLRRQFPVRNPVSNFFL